MTPVFAIVTALKDELTAVEAALPHAQRDGILLVRCGVGPRSAERFVTELLAKQPQLKAICSSGLCGALSDTLAIADCVVPTAIAALDASEQRYEIPLELDAMRKAVADAGVKTAREALVSARVIVCTPEEKRALGIASNAAAVDMETRGMLIATKGRVPVFALRAVSDAASDALPPEVADFVDEDGNLRSGKIAKFLFTQPHKIGALTKLQKHSKLACAALTQAWVVAAPKVLAALK